MNRFLAFVRKEFFHIIRDRRTLIILFGMPIAQVMIFGFALNNEVKDAGIVIVDHSRDYATVALRAKLNASDYFHIAGVLSREGDIEEAFRFNRAKLALIFPKDFSKKLNNHEHPAVKLIADASDPNQAQVLASYASAILMDYAHGRAVQIESQPQVTEIPRMVFNPELKAVYMFVPGVMGLILMLVSAMMTSLTIAKEKELGTMELLLVSPLRPSQIILGKVAPYWLLSFMIAVIIVLLGVFVFDVPLNGSIPLLMVSCLLFSFTALSLGIVISARATTQMTAMFLSMFATLLPTILLSGFIFPIENMPLLLRIISFIIPARWFIIIVKGVMIQGAGLAVLWKPFLILMLITGVLMLAGMKSVKPRLT